MQLTVFWTYASDVASLWLFQDGTKLCLPSIFVAVVVESFVFRSCCMISYHPDASFYWLHTKSYSQLITSQFKIVHFSWHVQTFRSWNETVILCTPWNINWWLSIMWWSLCSLHIHSVQHFTSRKSTLQYQYFHCRTGCNKVGSYQYL